MSHVRQSVQSEGSIVHDMNLAKSIINALAILVADLSATVGCKQDAIIGYQRDNGSGLERLHRVA
jgi:hypothetical protein